MDSSYGGNGSGEEIYNAQKGRKQHHRHSTQQIQRLEDYYKYFPHPDAKQRQQLGSELGLEPKQIKFWFQNKRTQLKAQNEMSENNSLRAENERIRFENLAMQEDLKNLTCPSCNGSCLGEDEKQKKLLQLSMENARLKKEHEQAMFLLSNMASPSLPPPVAVPLANMPGNHFPGEGMGPTTLGIVEKDKSNILVAAIGAINELMNIINVNEPVWVQVPEDGRYTLYRDSYDKLYPHPNHIKTANAQFVSSRHSGEVAMAATHLVEILLDADKWKDMFPTIVNEARTTEVLSTGTVGGSLQLMNEKVHVLSPLVAPWEFFFIRYCKRFDPATWVMVDVSYDFAKGLQGAASYRNLMFPSGCMIQDLSNGKSTVTWVEHVEVNEKSFTHHLYRDLVRSCEAYGAKRWITTLQRMSERFALSTGLIAMPIHEPEWVINTIEGQRNLMKLSHRMVKEFCQALIMSQRLEFPHMSDFESIGLRVSFRKISGPGQLDGLVVSAACTIWLPILKENLFEFLKDEKNRHQWDVLSSGNPVSAIARISTGEHPGNCISILQPYAPNETNVVMLQESSIDPMGAQLIYTPMDSGALVGVVNGEDAMKIPILPSGYIISGDGRANKATGASSSSSTNNSGGSLLTVAFQILVCCGPVTRRLNMESVATVHSLMSSTIQKIRVGLGLSD